MGNQIVYVTVRLELAPEADVQSVIAECNYNFAHFLILGTEITEVNEMTKGYEKE